MNDPGRDFIPSSGSFRDQATLQRHPAGKAAGNAGGLRIHCDLFVPDHAERDIDRPVPFQGFPCIVERDLRFQGAFLYFGRTAGEDIFLPFGLVFIAAHPDAEDHFLKPICVTAPGGPSVRQLRQYMHPDRRIEDRACFIPDHAVVNVVDLHMQLPVDPADAADRDVFLDPDLRVPGIVQDLQVLRHLRDFRIKAPK